MTEIDRPVDEAPVVLRRFLLRKVHRVVGLLSAPFIIISSLGGGILLLRKTGLYERKGAFREMIQGIHHYEVIMPYMGLAAVGFMLLASITGIVLFLQTSRGGRDVLH